MKKSHSISVFAIFSMLLAAILWFGPMAEAQSFLVPKKEKSTDGASSGVTSGGGYRGVIAPRPSAQGDETKKQATRPKYRIKKHVARSDAPDKQYQGMKTPKQINRQFLTQTGLNEVVGKGHIERGKARLADIERLQKMGFNVKAHIPRPASMTAAEADAYEAAVKKERAKIKRLRRALETIDTFLEDQQY